MTFNKHLDLGSKGLRCGTAQKELETKVSTSRVTAMSKQLVSDGGRVGGDIKTPLIEAEML